MQYIFILICLAVLLSLFVLIIKSKQKKMIRSTLLGIVGGGLAVGASFIIEILLSLFFLIIPKESILGLIVDNYIFTALVEEGFKFLAFYFIFNELDYYPLHNTDSTYNEDKRAIIISLAICLSFTLIEDLKYFINNSWNIFVFTLRICSILGHSFYGLLIVKHNMDCSFEFGIFILSIFLHGTFDIACTLTQNYPWLFLIIVVIDIYSFFYVIKYLKNVFFNNSFKEIIEYRNNSINP